MISNGSYDVDTPARDGKDYVDRESKIVTITHVASEVAYCDRLKQALQEQGLEVAYNPGSDSVSGAILAAWKLSDTQKMYSNATLHFKSLDDADSDAAMVNTVTMHVNEAMGEKKLAIFPVSAKLQSVGQNFIHLLRSTYGDRLLQTDTRTNDGGRFEFTVVVLTPEVYNIHIAELHAVLARLVPAVTQVC